MSGQPEPRGPAAQLPLIASLLALLGLGVFAYLQHARVTALEGRVAEVEQMLDPTTTPHVPAAIPSGTPAAPPAATADLPIEAAVGEGCTGAIAQPLVQQSVGQNGPGIFACYEEMRAEKPDFEGTLVVDLEIDEAGQVNGAGFGGTLNEAAFIDCVRTNLESWRFPPPAGGSCALVRVPFALSPQRP